MKWLVNWGVKKYVLGIINDILKAKKDGIGKARAVTVGYIIKIDSLLSFLKSLDKKIADNYLTEQEAEEVTDEAVNLVAILTDTSKEA